MLSSTVLGPIVVIIGVEYVVELVRVVSSGERIVPRSDRPGARRSASDAGDLSACPCCRSRSWVCLSYDLRGPTKAGSGGMMNVVALGMGTKSMMSL